MEVEEDILSVWDGPYDDDRPQDSAHEWRRKAFKKEAGELSESLKDPERREEALAKYLEKVETAAKRPDGLWEWHLLRVEGLDAATLIEALEIIALNDDHYEIDSLLAGDDVPDEVMIRGNQLMAGLGKINNLAWNLVKPGLSQDVADAIQEALLQAIDVQMEGGEFDFYDREKEIRGLLHRKQVSDKVKEKAKEALQKLQNPLMGDGVKSEPVKKRPVEKAPDKDKRTLKR